MHSRLKSCRRFERCVYLTITLFFIQKNEPEHHHEAVPMSCDFGWDANYKLTFQEAITSRRNQRGRLDARRTYRSYHGTVSCLTGKLVLLALPASCALGLYPSAWKTSIIGLCVRAKAASNDRISTLQYVMTPYRIRSLRMNVISMSKLPTNSKSLLGWHTPQRSSF